MESTNSSGNYSRLLGNRGFEAFLWTQFLGAFNDNVYKMMVSMLAVEIAANQQSGALYLSISSPYSIFPIFYLPDMRDRSQIVSARRECCRSRKRWRSSR